MASGRKKAARQATSSGARPAPSRKPVAGATTRKTKRTGSGAARAKGRPAATPSKPKRKSAAAKPKARHAPAAGSAAARRGRARATSDGPIATRAGASRSSRRAGAKAAGSSASPGRLRAEATLAEVGGPSAVPGLNEEDQIRAAKYLPRELSRRAFEEERFMFPETYGLNRIRLLVRDPEWIFAYWDVSPEAMKDLGRKIGERTLALSRLTLRVVDPVSGASSDILLPPGARWWYVRTDAARRTYRAELGVTLPSGEFRRLAESNTVVTPRVGPSAERARRRISYPDSREIPLSAAAAAAAADRAGVSSEPWPPGGLAGAAAPDPGAGRAGKGGASEAFGPGASDAYRR